jgi:hypothetical protein
MQSLPNNCRLGKIKVYPSDWADGDNDLLKLRWRITFRFYDDNINQSKLVKIESFNSEYTLKERRVSVRKELKGIQENLNDGYNPFLRRRPEPAKKEVGPNTPFLEALAFARSKLQKSDTTMRDIKTFVGLVDKFAKEMKIQDEPICNIKRKHLRELFDKCAVLKSGQMSPDKFNRTRTYIGIVYSELMEYDIVEANIPLSLKTKKGAIKRMRTEITDQQRKTIDDYLKEKYHGMWVYLHCFFHSGARSTEMFNLQVKDVDFDRQQIKYLVKKGKVYREVIRVMPDISVKYWREAVGNAPKDYYVFSRGRKPGPGKIRSYQISKSWNRHIKTKLKIDFDFYSLKHMKLTEISDNLGQQAAADQGGESVRMIEQKYDLKSKKRKDESLKRSGSEFA